VQRLLYQFQGAELDLAARRYADDLWQALQMNDRVRDLATNPLLLTVVAVIYHNNYVLPEDRASLYEECVEVLLRGGRGKADRAAHERRQYSGKAELSMGLDPRRELLAAVAYTMHQRGESGRIIERQDLIRTVADCLPARADAHEVARAFVAELPVHIGLLDEVQPDRFRFSHLSFQEFLAARHVAETDQWDDLLERYQENWWREVILLCAGHLSQARCWRFLGRLIEQGISPTERFAVLQLTMDALFELERFKGQWPRNDLIVRQALGILEAQPARAVRAAARVECGRVLGSLGDPRPAVNDLPPEMRTISGGTFTMGDGDKAHQVKVATFELARYPLTNAQWQLFMDGGGYNPDTPWWDEAGRAWLREDRRTQPSRWNDERFGIARPNHPVVDITWYEAVAFCRWLTQHQGYNPDGFVYLLPSEAEWEYAARRATRRTYPWGNEEPDAERANFEHKHKGTSAVGCFPAGATPEDGLHDLAGNVWEWTRSEYRKYPYDPADGREDMDNPAGKRFTIRGGGWSPRSDYLRASDRLNNAPDHHYFYVGCRVARRLPEA
jgi:formylglycine-generating enzyme required for sulfatase activity